MDKWFKMLREERMSRGSPAGIRRAMSDFLDTGPQTGGSPYKDKDNEKPRLKGKKNRNQVSAPPGAPGGGAAVLARCLGPTGAPRGAMRRRISCCCANFFQRDLLPSCAAFHLFRGQN